MARLISLEDIRRRYMLAVREVGGKKGVRARATGMRKALPAAENKLGGFKNFTISASSDPRIALAAAFFPSVSLGSAVPLPFRLARYFAVPSFPRRVSYYLVYFIIISPRQLTAWLHPASASRRIVVVVYSDSK